jgi:hypothetical protein
VAATINATLKSSTANSYVTLAEANSYFETVPDSATWDDKTDDQKNRALISAEIKYATYELARALANDTGAITDSTGDTGLYEAVKLGELEVKYNKSSQATGTVNNVFDVYPWLQSYLGAYCLGGSGSYQVRVVRG